jgi:hypothetical protein
LSHVQSRTVLLVLGGVALVTLTAMAYVVAIGRRGAGV